MSSRMDYKKKLMEYRKSIKATALKTVAFKEPTAQQYEDTHFYSSPSPPLAANFHEHRPQLTFQERTPIAANRSSTKSVSKTPSPDLQSQVLTSHRKESSILSENVGRYFNWNSKHALLATQPWCCIGDLMAFCDRYEFKAISVSDVQTHANIVSEVKSLLSKKAPFDVRRRFPSDIRSEGNLFVCIGRCPSIEYHLQRILTIFRRPLNKLSTDKQNIAKQNFHITIRELHLDISARITEVRLYDRAVFEKEFHLRWQENLEYNI